MNNQRWWLWGNCFYVFAAGAIMQLFGVSLRKGRRRRRWRRKEQKLFPPPHSNQGRFKTDSTVSRSHRTEFTSYLETDLRIFWTDVSVWLSRCVTSPCVHCCPPSPLTRSSPVEPSGVSPRSAAPATHSRSAATPPSLTPGRVNSAHAQRQGRTAAPTHASPSRRSLRRAGSWTVIPHHSDGLAQPGIAATSLPLRCWRHVSETTPRFGETTFIFVDCWEKKKEKKSKRWSINVGL